jgi:two-component system, NtrC family, sensor kinase
MLPRGRVPWVLLVGLCAFAAAANIAAVWWAYRWSREAPPTLPDGSPPYLLVLVGLGLVVTLAALLLPMWVLVSSDHRLSGAARRWARGEFSHRVDVGPDRGLWGLGECLNQMATALQRREETSRLREAELEDQAQRLAATAQLAAGVAHELNNPLGGILLYANLLRERTEFDDASQETIGHIIVQATRARDIVKGLLDYARQSPANLEPLDLSQLVRETLALLGRHAQLQAVHLRTELSKVPLWVEADACKLQQVFINIITNALDAMRSGGVVTVRTGFCEKPGFCRVAISDTGCGIPQENMPHLFEPFFTTKEVRHGVGLGLAMSYGIVQQHGGDIEVQSQVGVGSTFRVILPLASGEE